jgi:hypothetical protein
MPYETPDGITDFHAAGRHSHVTGLIRSGASIMEAKELACHAEIRQTAKYIHIGMKDRAKTLGNLPYPLISADADCLRIVCISGGVGRHGMALDDSADDDGGGGNEQAPAEPGCASSLVTNCRQKAVCGKVEAPGIAPEALVPQLSALNVVTTWRLTPGRKWAGRVRHSTSWSQTGTA